MEGRLDGAGNIWGRTYGSKRDEASSVLTSQCDEALRLLGRVVYR
jgi:hypothetical protein